MALVLVVEDEPELRELLRTNLQVRGFDVAEQPDGAGAIEFLLDEDPDIVVLDVMMPEVDGFDVLEFMRSRHESRLTPVIMLTARTDETDRVKGLSLGAQDYVVKPFSVQELMLRIKTLIDNREREAELIRLTMTDSVTDLLNGRYFELRLPTAIQESGGEMSLLWIHFEGAEEATSSRGLSFLTDLARKAADIISEHVEEDDDAFSFGGGQFAVITFRTGTEAAKWEDALVEELHHHLNTLELNAPVMAKSTRGTPLVDEDPDQFVVRISSGGQRTGKPIVSAHAPLPQKRKSVAQLIAEKHKARRATRGGPLPHSGPPSV